MIEQALYTHLQNQTSLTPFLARYGGEMAIFNQEAPTDTDPNWNTKNQYGRIVFSIATQIDAERKVSANLIVDAYCKSGEQEPEELEAAIRPLIDGYFFSEGNITMSAQWSSSDYFTEPPQKIQGITLVFTLLAFPQQTTIDPDPIALINEWSSEEISTIIGTGIRVIGRDNLPPAWKPTNEIPAIYWRTQQIQKCSWIPDTYNCSWMTATIQGHVLTPEKDVADAISRQIENSLTIKKRLIFADKSPFMLDRNIRVNPAADPLRTGQISIDGTYGILTPPRPAQLLNHIYLD